MSALQGKVAVITGGSSGIGLAIAKRFVAEGAYIFITSRRQTELDKAVAEIGSNVTAVQGETATPFTRSLSHALFSSTMLASASIALVLPCLPPLDSDGIAAATVAASSARIGDGESTLKQGIISAVNETACRLGARVGKPALDLARAVADKA